MDDQALQRHSRLNELAAEDEAYCYWKGRYEEAEAFFEQFANAQPKKVQALLFAYADGGRLMMQQKVNIACEYMRFPQERGAK